MTAAEREALEAQIETGETNIARFDALQADIDWMTAAKGTIMQVNFITGMGTKAVSDPDMITKAEAALVKLIIAREAEQAAI